jgi:hypothetical protein
VIGYERQKSDIIEKVEDNFKLVTIFRKFEVNFKYAQFFIKNEVRPTVCKSKNKIILSENEGKVIGKKSAIMKVIFYQKYFSPKT